MNLDVMELEILENICSYWYNALYYRVHIFVENGANIVVISYLTGVTTFLMVFVVKSILLLQAAPFNFIWPKA